MYCDVQLTNTTDLSYHYVAIPLGIRHYLFFNDNSTLFINAAYSYAFAVGKNSKAIFVNQGTYSTTTTTADAGYRYKRYSIEARYNTNKEILVNYAAWKSSLSSVSVIFGYKIF